MEGIATLGGGCFWCLEAIFQEVKGVDSVISGYMGGHTTKPTAQIVYLGNTGHTEVVHIAFDEKIISFQELLEIFFSIHDPTQLNRQGPDEGEEYRSVIFYHNNEQKIIAQEMVDNFAPKLWDGEIVTQVAQSKQFWPAEDYNQNFYRNNQSAGYCQVIINPKLAKFRAKFASKLQD